MLFIHSSVSGHLGRFYFLAVVYNTALKTGVQMSVKNSCFWFFKVYSQKENSIVLNFWNF